MYVNFEIAALFPSSFSRVKRAAISKQTFIWSPSNRSYIILALACDMDSSSLVRKIFLGTICIKNSFYVYTLYLTRLKKRFSQEMNQTTFGCNKHCQWIAFRARASRALAFCLVFFLEWRWDHKYSLEASFFLRPHPLYVHWLGLS